MTGVRRKCSSCGCDLGTTWMCGECSRARARANQKALRVLKERHAEEFERLHAQAKRAEMWVGVDS